MLTVDEAAVQLGVLPHRVRVFLRDGRIKAVKKGRDWDIDPRSLKAFAAKERKAGNPHKKRRPVQRMERKPGRPRN